MHPIIAYRKQHHLSQSAFAHAVGASQATVSLWEGGSPVPPERCVSLEADTGIACEELRPDLTWIRDHGRVVSYCVRLEP